MSKTIGQFDSAASLGANTVFAVFDSDQTPSTLKASEAVVKTALSLPTDTVTEIASLQSQINAISAPSTVSITDPLIYIQTFEDGTNVTGNGSLQLLNTLTNPTTSVAYTNASAAVEFPLTAAQWGSIDVTIRTYDEVVIQEAILSTFGSGRGTALYSAGGRHYRVKTGGIVIPNTQGSGTKSRLRLLNWNGSIVQYEGGSGTVFTKTCANLTELQLAIDYRWIWLNLNLIGDSRNDGSIGFDFMGGRSCLFQDIEIKDFGTAFTGCTLLQSEFVRFDTAQCLIGFDAQINKVTGASAAEQVWQPILKDCRFRMIDTTAIGCNFRGVEFPKMIDCGWEGSDALYAVKYDNAGNTVAKKMLIERGRAEINSAGVGTFTGAFLYVTGSDFHYAQINGLEWQMNTPNGTLVETNVSAGGTSRIYLENISGNTSNNRWKLLHNESGAGNIAWDFRKTQLQGNPTTSANVVDTTGYPNIWVGGVAPIVSRVYIEKYLT